MRASGGEVEAKQTFAWLRGRHAEHEADVNR